MDSRNTARRSKRGADAQFALLPGIDLPRSAFDRSSGHTTAFDSGYLIPVFVDEVLPGDTMTLRTSSLIRLATPLRPIMDNFHADLFFFFVPNRLVWDNFQKQMGEQDNPGDSIDFLTPKTTSPGGGYAEQSLQDYMGIPPSIAGLEHSSLPLRAYNLIYNEWFRPQELVNSLTVDRNDSDDDPADYVLRRRAKRHDYFTSALVAPQRGSAVTLPLGTSAPLQGAPSVSGTTPTFNDGFGAVGNLQSVGGLAPQNVNFSGNSSAGVKTLGWQNPGLSVDLSGVTTDLSNATAATIEAIRLAFQTQKFLERDARGGTRYTELIFNHFRTRSPDFRLQRPEYLGGGHTVINVHPVAATTDTLIGPNIGELGAFATAGFEGQGFNSSFTEHGHIIGLVNIRADLRYQQGLHRMWSRRTRFDYFWPTFQHLSEQAIRSKEIYADGSSSDDDVFGYIGRYDEYRYKPSIITGRMRSTSVATLDVWHTAQEFNNRPVLNEAFIEENPPISRNIAVPSEPEFIADFWFSCRHVRPMATYAVPGLIDHF